MKKILYIFIFAFILLNSCTYAEPSKSFEEFKQKYSSEIETPTDLTKSIYETDSYKANLYNFTQIDEHTFSDNNYTDSKITITVSEHKIPTSFLSYEDIYNVDYLDELEKAITQQFENSLNITCTPSISRIGNFSNYDAFFFKYKIKVVDDIFYYIWTYEIFADNYVYCIIINSPNYDYIATSNVITFINSFEIKDTTNLCTPSMSDTVSTINEKVPISSTTEEILNDNFFVIFIVDIIFTAVTYLFIPILIRFVFKNSFSSSIAFVISSINFTFIKILLNITLGIPLNANSAWLYLFVGQAILTKSKTNSSNDNNNSNSENKKETDDILTSIISELD